MTWPLETEGLRDFARGKRALLVVEEKRSFVESQIRDALYHLPADERPEISGKTDAARRAAAVAADGTVARERRRRAGRVPALRRPEHCRSAGAAMPERPTGLLRRIPAFCAGCPHGDLDQAAGRQLRHRRHRLPLHGAG